MKFERGDLVLVNYPFVTDSGMQQKVRPALVVSDHTVPRRFPDDVILAAITSQHSGDIMPNELKKTQEQFLQKRTTIERRLLAGLCVRSDLTNCRTS